MDEFLKFEEFFDPAMTSKMNGMMNAMLAKFKGSIDEMITYYNSKMASMGNQITPGNIKAQSEVAAGIENIKKSQKQYTEMEKEAIRIAAEHEKVLAKLAFSQSKLKDSTAQLDEIQKKTTASRRLDAKIASEAAGSLNQMEATIRKMRSAYAALSQAQRENSAVGGRMLKDIQQLDGAIKTTRASMGQHQGMVGQYTNALKGVGSAIMSVAAGYISLQGAISLAKNIFSTTKDLNVLSQSYKYLIQDQNKLAATQGFLTDITKRYGLELVSTSQSFLKFQASIQGSNFSMEQSQKLFGQVAKAGSIMGLSAQRMELIFLALEQMISKGTISAEELRRQLGDNLPSAMRTMADALGVTIPELMKMIKANKVLAEDALPKFGDQLEKQYGIEKVKTVHNLQTAVNDLKNEWTLFVAELKASDAFMTGLEKLGNYIQSIRIRLNPNDFIKSESLAKSQADYKEIITSLKTVNDAEKIRSGLTEKIQEAYKNYMGYVKVVNELSKQRMRTKDEEVDLAFATSQKEAYKKLGEELTKLLTSRTEFNKLFFPAKEPTPLVTDEELDNLKKALDEATGMIEKLEAEKALNDYKILKAKDESVIVKLNKENQVLDIQIKKLKDLGIEAERVRDAFIKIDENSVQGMADKANDAINKKRLEGISDNHRDAYNADLQRRLAFYRKVKKMDGENYEEQKAMLAQFHKDKVISDKEYFWTSTQLWMENNRATIDAAKELQEQAFNIANAIYDGKVAEAKREMDLYNEQIDALKDKLDKEKELKDQSKANDFDRLVSELHDQERLRNSAQKKYELYQKRQAQLKFLETQANLGVSVSEAFAASAGQGPAGWIAAIAAAAALIASFAAMQNQIKSIGKYAEGTEYLQRGNNPKGKDTIPVLANEGERIVPTDINSKLDGIDNDRLPEIYRFYKYNMIRGAGAVHTSSSADVIRELKRGRNVSEKMLNHFEDTPVGISLPDGRVMLKWGKNRTEIIELGKA